MDGRGWSVLEGSTGPEYVFAARERDQEYDDALGARRGFSTSANSRRSSRRRARLYRNQAQSAGGSGCRTSAH